tara:strand:+ start:320 stop:505 length:186 start_codon:yes stop_codon:yes gene_type:complete
MTDSNAEITMQDLQALWAINPLASEQLRRIIAERRLAALESSIAATNGLVTDEIEAVESHG